MIIIYCQLIFEFYLSHPLKLNLQFCIYTIFMKGNMSSIFWPLLTLIFKKEKLISIGRAKCACHILQVFIVNLHYRSSCTSSIISDQTEIRRLLRIRTPSSFHPSSIVRKWRSWNSKSLVPEYNPPNLSANRVLMATRKSSIASSAEGSTALICSTAYQRLINDL